MKRGIWIAVGIWIIWLCAGCDELSRSAARDAKYARINQMLADELGVSVEELIAYKQGE